MNEKNLEYIKKLPQYDQDLINEILALKKEKNVYILAHTYQIEPIQLIADVLGDSLGLSRAAQNEKDADYILFCGVRFMAETASILNQKKIILFPQKLSTCSMATYATAGKLKAYKDENPDIPLVLYINSTAEAKIYADVICTSSNSLHIVQEILKEYKTDKFAFSPDRHLGSYISNKINIPVDIVPEDGNCYVHNMYSVEDVTAAKLKYPNGKLLVHPESPWEVVVLADFVGSTSQIINYAKVHPEENEFIIGTEKGVTDFLRREYPNKIIEPLNEDAVCFAMKRVTLESIVDCLKNLDNPDFVVKVDPKTAQIAEKSIYKMMELSKNIK